MMAKMTPEQELVAQLLLERMDFDAAAKIFQHMGWAYGYGETRHIPDEAELEETARWLIGDVLSGRSLFSSCGRFEVARGVGELGDVVTLRFVPFDSEVEIPRGD